MDNEKYHTNCGLSKHEWELEKFIDKLFMEKSTLVRIGMLDRLIKKNVVNGQAKVAITKSP